MEQDTTEVVDRGGDNQKKLQSHQHSMFCRSDAHSCHPKDKA